MAAKKRQATKSFPLFRSIPPEGGPPHQQMNRPLPTIQSYYSINWEKIKEENEQIVFFS
ncbi:MAG: hypothetical protein MR286_08055 [Clostridiales bacterium]|nr:hypothetical protein [Clostridiales bacterium]